MLFHLLLLIASTILSSTKPLIDFTSPKSTSPTVKELVADWAPLVYLAPNEKFLPLQVSEYLKNVKHKQQGITSYLVTKKPIDGLIKSNKSFLLGTSPSKVPVYTDVHHCANGSLTVTYWFFYPYNNGKSVCTAFSPIGPVPIPRLAGLCLGSSRIYGDHLADWEHVTLFFKKNRDYPSQMYISSHTFGAYYNYNPDKKIFRYGSQKKISSVSSEVDYSPTCQLLNGSHHPILFAALGSHGMWPSSGDHKFMGLPKMVDQTGYGTPWPTWQHIENVDDQEWLKYGGLWGGPPTDCDPAARFLNTLCHYTSGPQGIRDPSRPNDFSCPSPSIAYIFAHLIADVVNEIQGLF